MRQWLLALLALGLILGSISPVSHAAAPDANSTKNKGLYISPLRTYLALDAGQEATRSFTIANLTDRPMTVTAHIEQFSVADYSYDYRFAEVDNNWLQMVENVVTLQPYESHEMAYRITLPKNAPPGGRYYTLYASSTTQSGSTKSTVQAATLLYLTVNGTLTRSSQIVNRSLPLVVITPQVNYSLDIKNTGNTHYFVNVATEINGLFYHDAPNGASQLLMPDKTRTITGSITSPLMPGIYRLNYTITPDEGEKIIGSHYFLFLPPWSIALLIIIFAVVGHTIVQKVRRKKKQA